MLQPYGHRGTNWAARAVSSTSLCFIAQCQRERHLIHARAIINAGEPARHARGESNNVLQRQQQNCVLLFFNTALSRRYLSTCIDKQQAFHKLLKRRSPLRQCTHAFSISPSPVCLRAHVGLPQYSSSTKDTRICLPQTSSQILILCKPSKQQTPPF